MKTPASANETITDQFLIKKWRLFFNLEKKAASTVYTDLRYS
jgi:hypothetical protein